MILTDIETNINNYAKIFLTFFNHGPIIHFSNNKTMINQINFKKN